MISLKIEHTKEFMNKLLLHEDFDSFLVKDALIASFTTMQIEGSRNSEFYSEEEIEALGEDCDYVRWSEIKPLCLQMIKGKKTPLHFKFVFKLSKKNVAKFLQQTGLSFTEKDVSGLYFHIRFEDGKITCITGTALHIFTMDKSLDEAWDEMIKRFLQKLQLDYEEL